MTGPQGRTPQERFWTYVDRSSGPDACWVWRGGCFRSGGYGAFNRGDRVYRAHRFSWELVHGPIPRGQLVCHHCDNPPCVNPAHLFLGTHADNIDDMFAKGRGARARGEDAPTSKLDAASVREIRRSHAEDRTSFRELARKFGVHASAIKSVVIRASWRHVP